VCGLAEVPFDGTSNVGETFHTVIKFQYLAIRDSDPFWYEADGYLTDAELAEAKQTTFSELIVRNTDIQSSEIQCFAMALPDGCGKAIASIPPTQPYNFLVTLDRTLPTNPLFGLENEFTYSVDGVNGGTVYVQRGKTYTFFVKASCNHAFYISTSPDIMIPPFAPAYDNVVNNFACLQQNPYVTLTVDSTTPSSLFYHCGMHLFMGGNITVVDVLPTVPDTNAVFPSNVNHPTTGAVHSTYTAPIKTVAPPVVVIDAQKSPATNGATIAIAILTPIFVIVIIALIIGLWLVYRRGAKRTEDEARELEKRGSKVPLEEEK